MTPLGGEGNAFDRASDRSGASPREPDAGRIRGTRYRLTSQLAALSADFLVLNNAGEHAYRFSGQSMSDRDTIRIEDVEGSFLYEAAAHIARKQARVVIVNSAGDKAATVLRQPVSPLRDRFAIELNDGTTLAVDGNVSTHEYSIAGAPGQVAEISRRWFRAQGSYGVEIAPGQPDALLLTAVVILDQMILGNT